MLGCITTVCCWQNYYTLSYLERQIGAFVAYYNNQRYHESLNNVTRADDDFSCDKTILGERRKIKNQAICQRDTVENEQHNQSHKQT